MKLRHILGALGLTAVLAAPVIPDAPVSAATGCAELKFITVYDPRVGTYAVGGSAWCAGATEWRVVVGCSNTRYGYPYLTTKGSWAHNYASVRYCPSTYPYAKWVSYERHG